MFRQSDQVACFCSFAPPVAISHSRDKTSFSKPKLSKLSLKVVHSSLSKQLNTIYQSNPMNLEHKQPVACKTGKVATKSKNQNVEKVKTDRKELNRVDNPPNPPFAHRNQNAISDRKNHLEVYQKKQIDNQPVKASSMIPWTHHRVMSRGASNHRGEQNQCSQQQTPNTRMPLTIIPLGVAKVIQMHSNNTPLREIHLVNGKMPYQPQNKIKELPQYAEELGSPECHNLEKRHPGRTISALSKIDEMSLQALQNSFKGINLRTDASITENYLRKQSVTTIGSSRGNRATKLQELQKEELQSVYGEDSQHDDGQGSRVLISYRQLMKDNTKIDEAQRLQIFSYD